MTFLYFQVFTKDTITRRTASATTGCSRRNQRDHSVDDAPIMTCASLMLASAAVFVALSTTSASAGSSGFYPRFASVISGGSSKSRATTNSKGIFGKSNKVTDIAAHFKKTAERLLNGIKSIPKNFLEGERLKKIRKAKGLGALTFSQYNFIERSSEDLSKIFRMVITIPFSPEFFFYSYIVFPAMASTNPFAWSAMSSG